MASQLLTHNDTDRLLRELNTLSPIRWRLANDSLECSLSCSSFPAAFGFMAQVALAAERLNHHPEWTNVYRDLSIQLKTHSAGGLTLLDFELAKEISAIALGSPIENT